MNSTSKWILLLICFKISYFTTNAAKNYSISQRSLDNFSNGFQGGSSLIDRQFPGDASFIGRNE